MALQPLSLSCVQLLMITSQFAYAIIMPALYSSTTNQDWIFLENICHLLFLSNHTTFIVAALYPTPLFWNCLSSIHTTKWIAMHYTCLLTHSRAVINMPKVELETIGYFAGLYFHIAPCPFLIYKNTQSAWAIYLHNKNQTWAISIYIFGCIQDEQLILGINRVGRIRSYSIVFLHGQITYKECKQQHWLEFLVFYHQCISKIPKWILYLCVLIL